MNKYFYDIYTKKELEILKRSNGVDPSKKLPWQIQKCSDNPAIVYDKLLKNDLLTDSIETNILNMNISELKIILKNHNLKLSGKKNELLDRVFKNIQIDTIQINKKYYITEKGKYYVDKYRELLEQEKYCFFKTCFNYIKDYKFNEAYRISCKYQLEQPIYRNGLGIDWEKEIRQGLSLRRVKEYSQILKNTTNINSTICSIFSDMSGYSLHRVISIYNEIFNLSLDSEPARNELTLKTNLSELKDYKGLENKYMFLATLDDRTCEKCGNLDGQVFSVKNAIVGVNFPPIHNGCRCTTIYFSDESQLKTRSARNKITHKSEIIPFITYNEWNKKEK